MLSIAGTISLFERLKAFASAVGGKFQHLSVDRKPVSKGIRLDVWALGFKTGYLGDGRGVTEAEWNDIHGKFDEILARDLGQKVNMYFEKYNPKRKFQFSFTTYIMYKEHQLQSPQ